MVLAANVLRARVVAGFVEVQGGGVKAANLLTVHPRVLAGGVTATASLQGNEAVASDLVCETHATLAQDAAVAV